MIICANLTCQCEFALRGSTGGWLGGSVVSGCFSATAGLLPVSSVVLEKHFQTAGLMMRMNRSDRPTEASISFPRKSSEEITTAASETC